MDYAALRVPYRLAEQALANVPTWSPLAGLTIANPDLVERLKRGDPFNEGDAQGFSDYPALA